MAATVYTITHYLRDRLMTLTVHFIAHLLCLDRAEMLPVATRLPRHRIRHHSLPFLLIPFGFGRRLFAAG